MRRHTHLLIGSVVVVLVLAVITLQSQRRLTGSVLSDAAIVANLKLRADLNGDQMLSVQEIRRTLTGIIRGVVSGNAQYDINGDGVIDRKDTAAAVRGLKMLLLAVCGNGRFDGTESCDDGNTANRDGCTNQCTVEAGYTCSGEPSECSNGDGPVCGNGATEAPEECDDGERNGRCPSDWVESCTYCSTECTVITVIAEGNGA